jgi:flavin-dependent dehydrogenase
MAGRADLLVAGGGPAGLAAAIAARIAGLSVVLLEHREAPIDKACGEGLMPSALRNLRALGVGLRDGHPIEGIRYADAADARLFADGRFPGEPARGVRRTELSRAMLERARALGVRFERHVVRDVVQTRTGVEVDGWKAAYLIAADGLRSPIRRRLGLERAARLPARFGVRRHYAAPPWSSLVEVHFAEGAEAYVTPVARGEVGVAFLSRGVARFDETLASFPLLACRLRGARPVSETRGAGPFEQRVARRVLGRVLLVGDAAGYLDPLTGEGVALALVSARAAVACVLVDSPADYERAYRTSSARYYRLTRMLLAVTRSRRLHRPLLALARGAPGMFQRALAYLDGA